VKLIENHDLAERLNDLLLEVNGRLVDSINIVRESCSAEEYALYGVMVGRIINSIFQDILEPIYEEHRDLKPAQLDYPP
jgi:hypothetical protein